MNKIGSHSYLLPQFAMSDEAMVLSAVKSILRQSYWNDIHTKSGRKLSIQITNAGDFGWFSDSKGYYYTPVHPITKQAWPSIPEVLKDLAIAAATKAGFLNFEPDCCLMNRYAIGTKLSLHQDVDEKDYSHPIVSISLGVPASFLWGGFKREDAVQKFALNHGDVIVFGGDDRLRFHGVDIIKKNTHSVMGDVRINLTFRKAS